MKCKGKSIKIKIYSFISITIIARNPNLLTAKSKTAKTFDNLLSFYLNRMTP